MEANIKTQQRRYLIFKIIWFILLSIFLGLSFLIIRNIILKFQDEEVFKYDPKQYENALYNYYEDTDLSISFEYKNNYLLKKIDEIIILTEIKTGNQVFQLFVKSPRIKYSEKDFTCEKWSENEICISKKTPKFVYKNLKELPKEKEISYTFYTRAESLSDILHTQYPKEDFSIYRGNCFLDNYYSSKYSGEICFAKEKGIITGIGNYYFPSQGVNISGYLKFIFKIFNYDNFSYDINKIDTKQFEQMTIYHGAYPLIAEGIYLGILENNEDSDIWPNRVIYKEEAMRILERFQKIMKGITLRDYNSEDGFSLDTKIILEEKNFLELKAKENPKKKDINEIIENSEKLYIQKGEKKTKIFTQTEKNIFKFLIEVENEILPKYKQIYFQFEDNNPEKIEGDLLLELKEDNMYQQYKLRIKKDSFSVFEKTSENYLDDKNLLPNDIVVPPIFSNKVANIKIYMEYEDFLSLFKNRTRNTRYKALFKIIYPDGLIFKTDALIKTRGNAGKGHIKSSYTLEFFEDLQQNFLFSGDSFLDNTDEILLRSQISDESRIREKLIYNIWRDLGYVSPEFFEVTLEINDLMLGFYQLTEDVKTKFFERRNIDIDTFIKPKNRNNSDLLANLDYNLRDETTLDFYEFKDKKDGEKLLKLIKSIKNNDLDILKEIDTQNIFDYGMFAYIASANDSLGYNYCLYKDKKDNLWKMFFLDADSAFGISPVISKQNVFKFLEKEIGLHNKLINFVYKNLPEKVLNEYYYDFLRRWKNIDLIGEIDGLKNDYKAFLKLDQDLWYGRFLEERFPYLNIFTEINHIRNRSRNL